MQFAANNVARAIAVNRMPLASASTAVSSYMPGWIAGQDLTITAQRSNAADPAKSDIQLRVVAEANATTPIHIFTNAFPLTLTADVAVKQELPFDN